MIKPKEFKIRMSGVILVHVCQKSGREHVLVSEKFTSPKAYTYSEWQDMNMNKYKEFQEYNWYSIKKDILPEIESIVKKVLEDNCVTVNYNLIDSIRYQWISI